MPRQGWTWKVDGFLFEPGSNRYLGRLRKFSQCPKGKFDALRQAAAQSPSTRSSRDLRRRADLLKPARYAMLYERGKGVLRSALDLPTVDQD
ncbi:hypothetical protein SS05631_c40900 [Sinorhizobium sp. CCBAU 05631]|nr:hypothetical protein [Sinorhizobium sp. CCBAU 05631]ASY58993.1 hypothetical protein SS05631_c40900 [Sinorhizobium sp. CCBAU 05631]